MIETKETATSSPLAPLVRPSPKTVLYLDHTAKLGGGEIALLGLVSALDRLRYTPLVVLASDGPLVARLQSAGVEVHVLPLPASVVDTRKESVGLRSALGQLGQVGGYAARLSRFARDHGAALIHTNSLKADLYGGLAGRLARIPTLWHVRDRIAGDYLPRPAAAAFRALAHVVPQCVVSNSQSTQDCLWASRSPRFHVVYDGCDAEAYGASEAPEAAAGDAPVVALVGRIAPWKGQHVFVEAAAPVLDRFPRARFWIVGTPLFGEHEYEASVRARVETLGIAGQVEFLGFRDDVPALLARTDVVVHASTHGEPFGQVVIEGMAAGRPVIATDGGALPEIVADGTTGLLVPMGDAGAMAVAIERLIADPARAIAMGQAGRARVRADFTIHQTACRMQAVYDGLLSEERHRR